MNKTYTLTNSGFCLKRSTKKGISASQKSDDNDHPEIDPPDEIITYLIRLSQTLTVVKTNQAGEVFCFGN